MIKRLIRRQNASGDHRRDGIRRIGPAVDELGDQDERKNAVEEEVAVEHGDEGEDQEFFKPMVSRVLATSSHRSVADSSIS